MRAMADRREEPSPRPEQQRPSQPPSLVQIVKSLSPVLPCANVSTALLGWIIFYLSCRCNMFDARTFTLGHFHSRLQVYKVFTYTFIHKSMSALVCNVLMLWYFGGAMEKNIGTVKYGYLNLLFTVLTGILYVLFGSIIYGLQNLKDIQGFTVVVFSHVGMSVFLSPLKHVVFITTIKLIYLPFILLFLAIFIPETSILGNVCGLGAGFAYAYGRQYFPHLDLHEMTAASMERIIAITTDDMEALFLVAKYHRILELVFPLAHCSFQCHLAVPPSATRMMEQLKYMKWLILHSIDMLINSQSDKDESPAQVVLCLSPGDAACLNLTCTVGKRFNEFCQATYSMCKSNSKEQGQKECWPTM
ncbi:uncharacterized protein rhbdd2 isoform X5 [Scyliorhinus torazame]|uniref:uncharacterized protein rhbdd2 isoform X5 n=1 Tax=Scyliorhinus torazame TaxID=75743 RepID=UPI003B5CD9E3